MRRKHPIDDDPRLQGFIVARTAADRIDEIFELSHEERLVKIGEIAEAALQEAEEYSRVRLEEILQESEPAKK